MRCLPLLAFLVSLLITVASGHSQEAQQIGSSTGARVAKEMPANPAARPELTYLAGRLSDEQIAELKSIAPNVRIVAVASRDEAMAEAAGAHGIDGRFASAELIRKAPELVWVHWSSAGIEPMRGNKPLMENEKIVLTNGSGAAGPAIADHSFAMLLMLTRNMRIHERHRAAGQWGGEGGRQGLALEGRTMLVVGLGGIGSEIAKRAAGFGMRVIAVRRSDAPAPEYVERVGKPEELMQMLPEADVVAIAVPHTPETEDLFNDAAFAAMKPGSYLINVARGKIVDTDAMVSALESGHLAGACLDVTDPEPLPPGHKLWAMDNVIITPHTSGAAQLSSERGWLLFKENIRRFGAGEPLLNTVDKQAGY